MIIPQYWADKTVSGTHPRTRKAVRVRRWGWSDLSQSDAEAHAETRAGTALQQKLSGDWQPWQEGRQHYGDENLPIREEILQRHGDNVITRNAYGAWCLNTPNVFFADLDFDPRPTASARRAWLGVLAALFVAVLIMVFYFTRYWHWSWLPLSTLVLLVVYGDSVNRLARRFPRWQTFNESHAQQKVQTFIETHPDWGLRVYRTPMGLRLLGTHAPMSSVDALPALQQLSNDACYIRLCQQQGCFRARLSGKPWRMGLRAMPKAYWPVSGNALAARVGWIQGYEAKRPQFAACRFVESVGQPSLHPDLANTVALHDRLCLALGQQPLA